MPARDLPCARCGDLLWRSRSSLPAGQAVCHPCRRQHPQPYSRPDLYAPRWCAHCGQQFTDPGRRTCSNACARQRVASNIRRLNSLPTQAAPCDDCGEMTQRQRNGAGRFCESCAKGRRRASYSSKAAKRRAVQRLTDITPSYLRALLADAHRCPLCSVRMTDTPDLPETKHVDHIVPMAIGGTHTVGNVRVICRTCNLTRPWDGSDLEGHQPTLWAQDMGVAETFAKSRDSACACGQPMRKGRCWTCDPSRTRARPEDGRQAALMRAERMKWQDIADALGFSGTGAALLSARAHGDPQVIERWPMRYERAS